MKSIFEVLELPTIHFEIQKYLIGILLNLTMSSETLDEGLVDDSISLDHADKFDARPLNCEGIYKFDTNGGVKCIHFTSCHCSVLTNLLFSFY